jgi:gliding motility-associated-like protein
MEANSNIRKQINTSIGVYKNSCIFLIVIFFATINIQQVAAQINCIGDTPFFTVDLTGDPSGTWVSPSVSRDGECCGGGANQVNCIELSVTLDPGAEGVIFNVESGANPGGALYYQVDCEGIPVASGSEAICLEGVGPHLITYCKVGNNQNTYSITSVPGPVVADDISIALDGSCTDTLSTEGFDPSTVSWNSVSPGYSGEYNNYLSNSDGSVTGSQGVPVWGLETVVVTPDANAPTSITYEVCGNPLSSCESVVVCQTVTVSIFSPISADILPLDPAICFGDVSETLDANPTGGVPPLSYQWSTGETTQSIDVFSGGEYSVIITDADGCSVVYDTVQVFEFTEEIIADAGDDILVCAPPSPAPVINLQGTVQGTTTGVWSNGNGAFSPSNESLNVQYTPTASEIASGSVTLILTTTNNFGCPPDSDTVEITIPPYFSGIQMNSQNVTCFGECNGFATAIPSGGQSPYSYVWSENGTPTGQTSQTATGLCPGSYDVMVTDAAGCTQTNSVIITEPSPLFMDASTTDVTCFGICDGEIIVDETSGGTSPYSYTLNGGVADTDLNFSGLCAGTYNVGVIDDNNCTTNLTKTVSEPPELLLSVVNNTPVTCDASNGSITVNASGGTTPYEYSLDGAIQASNTFGNLTADNYTIVVIDDIACEALMNVTVDSVDSPTAFVDSQNDLTCFGGNNGSVLIGTTNAVAPVSYSLNGGAPQASNSFTGLSTGSYTVDVLDGNNCEASVTFTINQPAVLTLNTNLTDASCFGVCDGVIEITAGGGTSPYIYSVDNGNTFSTNNVATGICPGNIDISVVVQDDNGCLTNQTVIIGEPDSLYGTFTLTDPVCFGSCDGEIEVSPVGGTPPYNFSIDGGAFQASNVLTGLCSGNHDIVIRDANGCEFYSVQTLVDPPIIQINQISMTESNCGFNDGELEVEATGDNPPFLYSANGGANQASGLFQNLLAGAYEITVTDALGCQASVFFGVNDVEMDGELVAQSHVTCYGGSDGTVEVINLQGADPISFELDNSDVTQTNGIFNGLSAGSHIVTIYDAGFCIYTIPFTTNQPDEIQFSSQITDATCNGGSDGIVELTNVTGGTGGYQYSIDGGLVFQPSPIFNNLAAGTYTVIVMDDNNCTVSGSVVVGEAPLITYNANIFPVDCNGGSTGLIQIVSNGGTGSHQYSIDGGVTFQASSSFFGLAAGNYDIVIEDANGCQITGVETVTEPDVLLSNYNPIDNLCFGECEGEININTIGGVAPYTYSVDNGVTTTTQNNISELCEGSYTVLTTDDNGCTHSNSTTINDPSPLTATINQIPSTCGNNDGELSINASGGTPTYTYSIDGGASFSSADTYNGLDDGNYSIIVQDDNSCTYSNNATVTNLPAPTIIPVNPTQPLCFGDSNGQIQVNASGGSGVLSYTMNGGAPQTNNIFSNLSAGTYSLVVIDENNCQDDTTIVLSEPTVLTHSTVENNLTCYQNSTGDIQITANGGTSPYQFSFDNGATYGPSSSINFLQAGTYDVSVMDDNGCTNLSSVTITEPPLLVIDNTIISNPLCYESCDGEIELSVSGGTAPYSYNWFGTQNPVSGNTASGLCAGDYEFQVVDDNNCTVYDETTIENPIPFVIDNISQTNTSCNGDCDGEVIVSSSDTVGYSLNGSPYQASGTFSNLCAGNYVVRIENAIGCEVDSLISISEPDVLAMSITPQDAVLCYGEQDTLQAFGSGGTLPYTYNWDNGSTTNYTFVSPTVDTYYSVSITDINGCETAIDSVLVEVSAPLTANFPDDIVECPGATVNLNMEGADGQPSYEYYWEGLDETSQNVSFVVDTTQAIIAYIEDQCDQQLTDTVYIDVNSTPNVSFTSSDDVGCAPFTVDIINTTPIDEMGSNCTWTIDGTTYTDCAGFTHTFTDPTCYDITFEMETNEGCNFEMTEEYFICVVDDPIADFSYSPEDPTELTNQIEFNNGSTGEETYSWSFKNNGSSTQENPTLQFSGIMSDETIEACLEVTSLYGCKDTICKTITFKPEFAVYVPNAFTPDGDDYNKTFHPVFPPDVDIKEYELLIFNRWGEILFESHNYNIGWDGTYGDNLVKDGTYIWRINLIEGENSNRISLNGHVTKLK